MPKKSQHRQQPDGQSDPVGALVPGVPVPNDLVVMAHVKEPYGLKGWVKLYTHSEEPFGLARFAVWWLGGVTGGIGHPASSDGRSAKKVAWRSVFPVQTGEHSGTLIAKLPGADDRDSAFALKGVEIAVPRSEFGARGENDYYWADLIGLGVTNRQGDLLGSVMGLMDLGPHQVLRVKSAGAQDERLIPFVAQYVDGVDLAAKMIRVDWGLDF